MNENVGSSLCQVPRLIVPIAQQGDREVGSAFGCLDGRRGSWERELLNRTLSRVSPWSHNPEIHSEAQRQTMADYQELAEKHVNGNGEAVEDLNPADRTRPLAKLRLFI